MINHANARYRNSASVAKPGLVRRFAHWAALFFLCIGMLSGGATPVAVHASQYSLDYEIGHYYIRYSEDHIPSPTGTLEEAIVAQDPEGHVFDLYNNQVVINNDSSISNTDNQVVGFVYY